MSTSETTTLAGGCFWCLEAVYDDMQGVLSVESGYMGGRQPNPSYEAVCSGRTGHAEVVQVTFDPQVTNDSGTQYRSAIFYHSDEQRATAEQSIRELTAAHAFRDPIVTEVAPASQFYIAEDYHQEYFAHNPHQGYCSYVVAPKVQKFRHKFAEKVKQP